MIYNCVLVQDSSQETQTGRSTEDTQNDREVDFGEVNIDCMVSEWSDWSECSATCGKSYKFKRRIVKQDAIGKGKKCPRKLEKKRRCETQKCRKYEDVIFISIRHGTYYRGDK